MADFCIRKGDRLPELRATLTGPTGAPVDLTGLTVKFHMRPANRSTVKVNASATVVTAVSGVVKYAWAAVDTDTAGQYDGEFEVTFGDGRKQTFPNPTYIGIRITDEVA